jgi:hypothetical protein
LLVLVPFVRGWRVGVRASRSADSTSVALSHLPAIAQTRERNCWLVDPAARLIFRAKSAHAMSSERRTEKLEHRIDALEKRLKRGDARLAQIEKSLATLRSQFKRRP